MPEQINVDLTLDFEQVEASANIVNVVTTFTFTQGTMNFTLTKLEAQALIAELIAQIPLLP